MKTHDFTFHNGDGTKTAQCGLTRSVEEIEKKGLAKVLFEEATCKTCSGRMANILDSIGL